MPGTSANAGLTAARTNKNDEYYTQLPDIEVELRPNHIVKQYDLNKELGETCSRKNRIRWLRAAWKRNRR